jgi:glycerol uptake facilitator-like aquaporin
MADRLAGGNVGLTLLANSIATGAMLVALILTLGPISGAHINPAVSLVLALRRQLKARDACIYVAAQLGGAIGGVALAHAMFGLPVLSVGATARSGGAQWLSEFVATFGLVCTVLSMSRERSKAAPYAVACYIVAAYWFTASTSFANPAVTFARTLTDTFTGISPADAPAFVVAQGAGACCAAAFVGWLFGQEQH